MSGVRQARANAAFSVVGILIIAMGMIGTRMVPGEQNPPPPKRIYEPTKARLERGRYLVEGVVHCFSCHSQTDWAKTGLPRPGTKGGGGQVPDDLLPFKVFAPNISPDPETGAGTWRDEDFVRALRQGIGHDGRTLFPFMPYFFFRNMSDEDLASVITYVRSIPPVRHKVPKITKPQTPAAPGPCAAAGNVGPRETRGLSGHPR